MKRIALPIASLAICLSLASADAYELATHGALTEKAYERSILTTDPQLLKGLGIDASETNVFGEAYYDVSGNDIRERTQNNFEKDKMPNEGRDFLTVKGWLLRGAIREDDIQILWMTVGGSHDLDPYGNLIRVLHHFYDPVHDRPLRVGVDLGERAPNWAIGTTDAFVNPLQPNTSRRNHFTVFDAREAMYRALTGKNRNGDAVAPTKSERDKYWATLFRALGDIVHLVQDMGQPQHTRNDPHAGKKFDGNAGIFGHKSVFETYVESRAMGTYFRTKDYVANEQAANIWIFPPELTYDNYPVIPRFTDYLSYFTTRHKHPDPNQITVRQGLADYSNRGFFSVGQNLDTAEYAFPSRNPGDYASTYLYVNWAGQPLDPNDPTANATILMGAVVDSLPGGQSAVNVPLTTYSLWDQFLVTRQQSPVYSLNRYHYDAMANLLIPRAVAYSAGLIDYFFRGRIEAEDAHFTDSGISLKVRNVIDPDLKPEWRDEYLYAKTRSGNLSTLTITYEYKDEQDVTRYVTSAPVPLVTDPNNSANDDNIAPGEVSKKVYSFTINVPFIDPNNPKIYKDLKYRLVYRGRLGNEDDAVAAATFRPVSGFLVSPSYPPVDALPTDVTGELRMIFKTSSAWKLAPDRGLRAGNIDWKGRYEADPADPAGTPKPTKVLSWVGPKMRYFPDDQTCYPAPFRRCQWFSSSDFSREIFENGDVIANAPANVLGAAITRDLDGKDWLVAICMAGTEDVVYRRPYRKGSDAAYDPVNAPNGWKEIGRFDASILNQGASRTTHHADIPWFFSGDGRKAQTTRRWWETTSNDFLEKLMRLEINITDDIALALPPQNHDNLTGFEETHTCSTNYDQYGAGTGQSTYSASGEYIVAVDYDKDGNEILAKIRIMGNSTKTSNVSVAHNHQPNAGHSNDVLTGATQVSESPYKEELLWKDGNILSTFSDGWAYDVSWGSGPQPSNKYYTRTIDRTSHQKEISYIVDLRYNLYSYYYVNIHDKENIAGGVTGYVGDIDEGNEITSDLMPSKISLYSDTWPTYTSSTSPYRIERELNCDPFIPSPFNSRRYGLSNFGWFQQSPGSGMVDSRGNYAISHPSAADFGYKRLTPTNLLSGGRFEDVIKNAPPNAFYYPVSVLY